MAIFLNDLKKEEFDVVIIGAGISGATLAERYARLNKKILIIEKRNHIGGNCFDFLNNDGILVSLYGPHYFHTNDEEVWNYVNSFSEWFPYEHRVVAHVNGMKVPVPVNQKSLNMIFGLDIKTEEEAKNWYIKNSIKINNPTNAKDAVLARMGKDLYNLLFKGYTLKQWGINPEDLAPEVTNRIPIRYDNDDRYFTDKYQALPKNGYTKLFEEMLKNDNIFILLNKEWSEVKPIVKYKEKLFFTGRIDQYFNEKYGKLEYRSLDFKFETLDREFFQEYAQENYPSLDVPFTRIVEYKHATGQKNPKTTISREYSTWVGEPYYPVPSEKNQIIYKKYQDDSFSLEKENVYFVGRLANYKYFNMDQAFKNALDLFKNLEKDI